MGEEKVKEPAAEVEEEEEEEEVTDLSSRYVKQKDATDR